PLRRVMAGMTNGAPNTPVALQTVRLWPGVLAVAMQWLAWFVVPVVIPEAALYGMMGGLIIGGLGVLIWWLFLSRAPWIERIGAPALAVAGMYGTSYFVHASISNGAMGMLLPFFSVPVLCLALVVGATVGYRLPCVARRTALATAIL